MKGLSIRGVKEMLGAKTKEKKKAQCSRHKAQVLGSGKEQNEVNLEP
jgi:hypothetical protein